MPDRPAHTTTRTAGTRGSAALTITAAVVQAAVWAWAWRIELTTAIVVVEARDRLAGAVGIGAADLLVVIAVTAAAVWPPSRRLAGRIYLGAERRRRWQTTLTALYPPPATPRLAGHGRDWTGEWATVRVPAGATVTGLVDDAEILAAALDVADTRVTRTGTSAAWATVRALRCDPLDTDPGPWPWMRAARTDLWWPTPVGVDENGRPAAVALAGHNLLIGGEPGAGKSVALSQLVAAAALDPSTSLYLLDGKLVELASWKPVAAGTAGIDIGEGIDLLTHLRQVMDDCYRQLLADGLRKVPAGAGLHVAVVDELAHYLTWPDKKPRDAFTDLLRDLVSRGRAAGIVVIAATQKPASEVVPTSLRDLFGYRWALRCTTNAASDTILGTGWATNGASAATIKPASRGVGWLLHESGIPVRLRAHHLADTHLAAIAARAVDLRRPRPGQPVEGGRP